MTNTNTNEFHKVVRIGTKPSYGGRGMSIYCGIHFKNSRLSISGVEGPMPHGGAVGGCGQIDMHLRDEIAKIKPAPGWDVNLLTRFFAVWGEWHLNDMRPTCEHQEMRGWRKMAGDQVTLYHFRLKTAVQATRKEIETAAMTAVRAGESFTPTPEQAKLAGLAHEVTSHREHLTGPDAHYYEPAKPLYQGGRGPTETKSLGWLRPEEHPEGLLCRPCPECGYKYGTSRQLRPVPADVLEFLRALPDTDKPCPWSSMYRD